jgi:shikimate dehydrogenase
MPKIKAGVIGDPISHSLSPQIHNYFLKKYNIDGSYEAILIKKENLLLSMQELVNQGFSGFNVTIPHKEVVFKICDFTSKTAQLTKAVNTLIITPDKRIFGHNSDAEGFLNNLEDNCPDFDLKDKIAFVIGAGGAARAIVYALIKNQVKNIFITNRNHNRALNLIDDFAIFAKEKKCELNFLPQVDFEKQLNTCDLLINSTSLGMENQEELKIDLEKLKKTAIVYDIVYKPLETELLKLAKSRGNRIITGIGMLIHQALIGFEAWFGKKPEIDQNLIKSLCK